MNQQSNALFTMDALGDEGPIKPLPTNGELFWDDEDNDQPKFTPKQPAKTTAA
jgi:hypothetical protein